MYDKLLNVSNFLHSEIGAGGNPNPYDPNWEKKGGKWSKKGESTNNDSDMPEGLTAKGELAWGVHKKTGLSFEDLNSKAYTAKELKGMLAND